MVVIGCLNLCIRWKPEGGQLCSFRKTLHDALKQGGIVDADAGKTVLSQRFNQSAARAWITTNES